MREQSDPIMDLNTTPLIDVMLVLLVMFIVTIPIQTHAIKIDLPNGPPVAVAELRSVNLLTVEQSGGLRWNGAAIDQRRLSATLQASQQMSPIPELHLRPDPMVRYDVVDGVLATIKRNHVARFGFVGNEAYALPSA